MKVGYMSGRKTCASPSLRPRPSSVYVPIENENENENEPSPLEDAGEYDELDELMRTSVSAIWKRELDALEQEVIKYEEEQGIAEHFRADAKTDGGDIVAGGRGWWA